jgi:hypothetical protein
MRTSLRLNCSTPWPPNPLHRQGQLPLHDLLSKICDKTDLSACGKYTGLDHGVGHSLLLLYDVKAPNGQKSK